MAPQPIRGVVWSWTLDACARSGWPHFDCGGPLLGPRQVGKTTLALEVADAQPSVYLDLESEADLARLREPELYLEQHADALVVLDSDC